jgi:N-methylhydantoinase A
VIAATRIAAENGFSNLITYDMGGTSTDVCLLKGLRPTASPARVIGGLPLKTSQLDINSIGAGGGSIGWLDMDGSFRVGPRSAGAEPGPACYGRGGREATVADANLVLRRLGPSTLLGNRMRMHPDLALAAMQSLAARLGVPDVYHAADGVIKVAVANMVSAIRTISIEIGEDPRDFALIPFGGAGPLHACLVAEETGISTVVVPPHPGNLSALGLLTSDLKHELVRTYLTVLHEADADRIRALLDSMEQEGRDMLSREGMPEDRMAFLYSADMRYVGQGHELNVWLTREEFDVQLMAQRFHNAHLDRFTYSRDELPIQLVNLRTTATGRVSKLSVQPLESGGSTGPQAALKETRSVHLRGEWMDTRVYRRERLLAGMELAAPAVVEEMGSTTLIPPGWTGRVDSAGNMLLLAGGET